ncbi:MAG: glycosyltransferase [Xanthomonadales bacterium]|nr:glycosyltransferase family 2 protein [Xanthomonadales bacterium]NIX12098.1 glycosyltransferase [Xanthomonadales bacterium]
MLSIIIVNYRSWEVLKDCLTALAAGGDEDLEVIVVDNCSDDGRLGAFAGQFPSVRFIESDRNGGFAHGCNLGAGQAHGGHLLFMNPDVIPEPGQVSALLEIKLANPDVAILGARQVDARGRTQKAFDVFPDLLTWYKSVKSLLRVLRPSRFPNPRRPGKGLLGVDWVSGSILLIGRSEFERLGRWCEEYWMYVEDCDLCYTARRQGLEVAFSHDVSFVHLHGGASRRTPEITATTKAETVISKHVFIRRHSSGMRRVLNHAIVASKSLAPLAVYGLLDLLTLRRVRPVNRRASKLPGLLRYYAGAPWSRGWCSPRAPLPEHFR